MVDLVIDPFLHLVGGDDVKRRQLLQHEVPSEGISGVPYICEREL